jgi:lipoprotein-anchoring transpeptidase ErfK/SrfK
MSRGNINYKYLRRRKNGGRKFLKIVLWILLVLAVVAGIVFGVIKLKNSGVISNYFGNKQANSSANNSETTQETQNNTQQSNVNVVWIDDKEPAVKDVNYTVPKDVEYPYTIKVNRAANCVTVYGIDDSGNYSIPVKAFACSCGREGEETITGENYKTTDKYLWRLMVDNTYGHYATRIYGGYLFHSVPFLTASSESLETAEYNKLGSFASLGCVRLCVRDVKWIYDNCTEGTKVAIYDDAANPGPLGKPESIKIPEDSKNAGWDPTDPDESNPWNQYSAKITGAQDVTTKVGQKVNLLSGVTATDTCGNDITSKLSTVGHYTFDQTGEYDIKYEVTDAIGSKAEVTVKLIVQ